MTPTRTKETERAPWNLTDLRGGGGGAHSRPQNLDENSPEDSNQNSREKAVGAANQSQEGLACGFTNHKIKHCDSNRTIYEREKNGTLTKKIIQDTLRKE